MTMRPSRVLAFVAAHPDDDVLGAVAIVAKHRGDPTLRFVLVHATDGEAGQIAPGSGRRGKRGAVRREEDRSGWRVVGRVPDRHEWLGFPDGALADLPVGLLAGRVAEVFAEERPDVAAGRRPHDPTRLYDMRGVPDHEITFRMDVREQAPLVEPCSASIAPSGHPPGASTAPTSGGGPLAPATSSKPGHPVRRERTPSRPPVRASSCRYCVAALPERGDRVVHGSTRLASPWRLRGVGEVGGSTRDPVGDDRDDTVFVVGGLIP